MQHQGNVNSQAPADNIGPGPLDYIFDTPSDGTAGSRDENAGTISSWR